jgi:uncharacterized protein (DUF1800 family)
LIKRFVTSNPSRDYVRRVARAFADNGFGVRGDMRAVWRAVFLDPEARSDTVAAGPTWGKLREPVVRFANWLRAFPVNPANGVYRIWNLEDPVGALGQNPMRAPSVFNWYRPDYAPPGAVGAAGLVAPEFQIAHETTVIGYANFMPSTIDRGHGWGADVLMPHYGPELRLVSNTDDLLDRLGLILLGLPLSAPERALIKTAVDSLPPPSKVAETGLARVKLAIALVMLSPEYLIQK